jgi:flavin-binding protein dodecin
MTAIRVTSGLVSFRMGPEVKGATYQIVSLVGSPKSVTAALTSVARARVGMHGDVQTMGICMLIHNSAIGVLIGRKGATIRQTRRDHSAQIQIGDGFVMGSQERLLCIHGTVDAVGHAIKTIVHQLSWARVVTPSGGYLIIGAGVVPVPPSKAVIAPPPKPAALGPAHAPHVQLMWFIPQAATQPLTVVA